VRSQVRASWQGLVTDCAALRDASEGAVQKDGGMPRTLPNPIWADLGN
jgi:hypothetical protein